MKSSNRYIANRLKPEIEKLLAGTELELFDVVMKSEKGMKILRVSVDTEAGAGIEDVTEATTIISDFLDENDDIIKFRYDLEVSTPGLERPLRNEKDFKRFMGKKCKIMTVDKDASGRQSYTGKIDKVEDNSVTLFVEKENAYFNISIENISKANLVIEFD
ncbi:MAG: ribosome maturation factor [Denitrovibrio sp.]|nr:MAG: ribosome maturation factor [Denitrovibrio sp.]